MSLNKPFSAVDDEALETVSGGYLHVSKWRDYVATQIMPILNGLMSSASPSDQSIISIACNALQNTLIPNAEVAQPVRTLWSSYNNTYRVQLQSDTIKRTLDQTLYNAKLYIDQNS